MLLIVGTYSETLGHVDGKGEGLSVLNVDERNKDGSLAVNNDIEPTCPVENFFGRAQKLLGSGAGGSDDAAIADDDRVIRNPTYLTAHRDSHTSEVHVYVVDEREDESVPGTVTAARLNERTGELTKLGDSVPADDRGGGTACCHISVSPDAKYVLAANYLCGSIVAIRRKDDGSLDTEDVQYVHLPPSPSSSSLVKYPGPNSKRQERSHAHMVLFSPGTEGTTVLVPDLGSDAVWSVPYNLGPSRGGPLGEPVPTARHPALAGSGPRHVALHPNNGRMKVGVCYVAYELTSLVASFRIDERTGAIVDGEGPLGVANALDGRLVEGGALLLPSSKDGPNPGQRKYEHFLKDSTTGLAGGVKVCSDSQTSVAAIRVVPDGSAVLVSSRIVGGEGAVSAIPLGPNGEMLGGDVRIANTLGRTPRDFVVLPPSSPSSSSSPLASPSGAEVASTDGAGLIVLVANQDTDSIAMLERGEEKKAEVFTEEVPTPVCLCVVPT